MEEGPSLLPTGAAWNHSSTGETGLVLVAFCFGLSSGVGVAAAGNLCHPWLWLRHPGALGLAPQFCASLTGRCRTLRAARELPGGIAWASDPFSCVSQSRLQSGLRQRWLLRTLGGQGLHGQHSIWGTRLQGWETASASPPRKS